MSPPSDIPSDLATIKTEETTHLNTSIDVPDINLHQTRHLPNRNNALIELILFCTTNAGCFCSCSFLGRFARTNPVDRRFIGGGFNDAVLSMFGVTCVAAGVLIMIALRNSTSFTLRC